jgi:hypothetical protein
MQITISLPPELLEAIQKNTAAVEKFIAQLEVQAVLPKEVPAKPKKEEAVEETFKKNSYFYHSESDSFVSYKKGEAIPTDADFLMCNEVTKAAFDKGNAAKETPPPVEEEPDSFEEDTPIEETPVQAISLEVVRKKLADLSAQGKAQQQQVKAALTELGFKKLSDVPAESYGELLTAAGAD